MLSKYKTLIFDCDGVLLDSNKIKTAAFYESTRQICEIAALELTDYHKKNGGISRYEKFNYFASEIVEDQELDISVLLKSYKNYVIEKLLSCPIAKGIQELRDKTIDAKWMVVSGGDQEELRMVFKKRGLIDFFDSGIYGSPEDKVKILVREIEVENVLFPALYIGDSKYDFSVSVKMNLDFIFINGWTEVTDWEKWTSANNIKYVKKISEIANGYS